MAVNAAFWRNRPTFMTGASGRVGSSAVRGLVDASAEVVGLMRGDGFSRSELVGSGIVRKARGDLYDQELPERTLGGYEDSSDIRERNVDAKRARMVIHWGSSFTLDEALNSTVSWRRDAQGHGASA